ncbi:ABC transporter ATP-binding protein [Candidatus Bathyarchaeota archaeon]|nr:ABC transporter ATP-binding protein [Candidatus Bathyarchaeota archaeon]
MVSKYLHQRGYWAVEKAIEIHNLTKRYKDVCAVENLNLSIENGEIFGFLGPNGAGKTTTIRALTGLAKPTSGSVSVCGFNVASEPEKVKRVIGVVQQHFTFDLDLNLRENMELHARLHHIPKNIRRQRIDELLEFVSLTKQSERLVEDLSGGMKKAAMIARALLHQPKIIFLDEPTVGLDVQIRRRMWDLIRKLSRSGTTIFLTTHYIEEAEALCSRVGIVNQGHLIALGSPSELRGQVGLATVEMLVGGEYTRYEHFVDRQEALAYMQCLPSDVKAVVRDSSLEDVFVKLTGKKVEADGDA